MGLRFRKSVKIAPGIKLNFGRKSHSVTFGGKGFHHTISSTGRRTTTAGIPGTGISYSTSSGGKKTKSKKGSESMSGSGNKNGGCLTIVLGFFAICLALAIYSFAWIPAIVFLVYFILRKNTPNRKTKIGISLAVMATSLLLFAFVESETQLEGIEVAWPDTTFYVNDSVEVAVKPVPESAEIKSLELSNNNIASLDYENGVATVKFNDAGKEKIKFVANGSVESDSTEITVIKKGEEEKEKKETSGQEEKTEDVIVTDILTKPDFTAKRNTTEMVDQIGFTARKHYEVMSDEQADQIIDSIKSANHNYYSSNDDMEKFMWYGYLLDYKYDDGDPRSELGTDLVQAIKYVYRGVEKVEDEATQANLLQIDKSLAAIYPEEEAVEEPAPEVTEEVVQEVQETQTEEMAYLPEDGEKYHNDKNCSGMENPREVTISEAEAMGYEPCKRCY